MCTPMPLVTRWSSRVNSLVEPMYHFSRILRSILWFKRLSDTLSFSPPPPLSPVNKLGLRGTYQGLTATIVKQGSNQAIRFFVYTSLKKWIQEGDNSKDIGSVKTFLIGGVAGAASVFGNTPVDVVKTRMQVCT